MKNFKFILMLVGLLPLLGYSQTIDTSNKNRFFPQRLHQPKLYYFHQAPDKYGFDNQQRGPHNFNRILGQQVIPDSIYMKSGKVVMIFDERKIKQFIQNRKRKWMNL
jgi:hypothetical protein